MRNKPGTMDVYSSPFRARSPTAHCKKTHIISIFISALPNPLLRSEPRGSPPVLCSCFCAEWFAKGGRQAQAQLLTVAYKVSYLLVMDDSMLDRPFVQEPFGSYSIPPPLAEDEPDVCRVCRSGAAEDGELFWPCQCSGSMRVSACLASSVLHD